MAPLASAATSARISTGAMPDRRRIASWREEFARGFLSLDIEPHDPAGFTADATVSMWPGLKMTQCAISASRWRRTRAMIDPGTDDFGLMFGSGGPAMLSQQGRTLELGPGDAGLCLHTEPADLTLPFQNKSHLGIVVPLKALLVLVPDLESKAAFRIAAASEPLRLLKSYLDALADPITLANPELTRAVVQHVHDLIALAIGTRGDAADLASGRGLRAARLRSAKVDVLANLASNQLSAVAVAKRQGISPRYLHMLFEAEETTFSQYVLDRRLTLARRLLADPRQR